MKRDNTTKPMKHRTEGHMRMLGDIFHLLLPILALLCSQVAFAPAIAQDITHSDELTTMQKLRISANHRFLVTNDDQPFFWLGETAWRLSVLTPAEIDVYMESRVRHAFNVIQIHPGFEHPDYAGNLPFLDGDTYHPNEAFWSHIDLILAKARTNGLYIALVPLWGQEYAKAFRGDVKSAYAFGQWICRRYACQSNVVWIVSGEYDAINNFRLPVSSEQKAVINAAAEGIRDGHKGTQLMTIHPGVARTSSLDFHRTTWLDFNMLQSGHFINCEAFNQAENHALIVHDYGLTPTKPVLDGEPIYEDTPDGVWVTKNTDGSRADAAAVRRKAYWAVFSGGCGHTYGHNDVYPFCDPDHPSRSSLLPQGPGLHDWRAAIESEGATQMKYVRFLIESRPFLDRIPDPSIVVGYPTTGLDHVVACRAIDGSYAMIYSPLGKPVTVDLDKLSGDRLTIWWYDPRYGTAVSAGKCNSRGVHVFTPPDSSNENDWVLVLDDTTKGYVPPGTHSF